MDMSLTDLQGAAGLAVIVLILVQVVKKWLPEDIIPLFALGLGVVISLLVSAALGVFTVPGLAQAVLTGLLGGASSIGLYQVQKPVGILGAKADTE